MDINGFSSRLGQYAGFVSRLIAWIIDRLVIAGTFFITGWIASFVLDTFPFENQTYQLVVLALVVLVDISFYLFYFIGLWMISGQTLGKSLMRLRIIRADGGRLKLRNAIIRFVAIGLSGLLLFMGYLMVIVDRRRQALHDKIAGTIVVYSESSAEKANLESSIRDHIKRTRVQSQREVPAEIESN